MARGARRRWQLQLGYDLVYSRPSQLRPGSTSLRAFGEIWAQNLRIAGGLALGKRWQILAQMPLVWLMREQADPRHVVGLGDLETLAQLQVLPWQTRGGQRVTLRLHAGADLPLGRYQNAHTLKATYLEPNPQSGALLVHHLQAYAGASSGVPALRVGAGLLARLHPWWGALAQSSLRVPLAPAGSSRPRFGILAQSRAGVDLARPQGSLRHTAALDWSFAGADEWGASGTVRSATAHRLDLVWRLSFSPTAKLGCAVQAGAAVWQRSVPGALVPRVRAGLSCGQAWGQAPS